MTPDRFAFKRGDRMLEADAFTRAFSSGERCRLRTIRATVSKNDLSHARLGLAVSKKSTPKAVDRNRLKRQIRESFRCNADQLLARDFVFMVNADAHKLPRAEFRSTLEEIFDRFKKN